MANHKKEWGAVAKAKTELAKAQDKFDGAKTKLVEALADEIPYTKSIKDEVTGLSLVVARSFSVTGTVPSEFADAASDVHSYALKKGADLSKLKEMLGSLFADYFDEKHETKIDSAKASEVLIHIPVEQRGLIEGMKVTETIQIRGS